MAKAQIIEEKTVIIDQQVQLTMTMKEARLLSRLLYSNIHQHSLTPEAHRDDFNHLDNTLRSVGVKPADVSWRGLVAITTGGDV